MNNTNQFVIYPHPANSEPQPDLEPKDKLIYLAIRRYMNHQTMECFPSYAKITEDTGAAAKTIKKCVENLVKEGYLKTRKQGRSIVYTFNNQKYFEPYSYDFLDKPDLTFTEKAYIVATHQYMFKDENEGQLGYTNKELSNLINMPESTISKCNRSLEKKGYLEGASDLIKKFPQDKLNLIFIAKFKDQDTKIEKNSNDIAELKRQLKQLLSERDCKTIIL
jgi:biotin operon repressor